MMISHILCGIVIILFVAIEGARYSGFGLGAMETPYAKLLFEFVSID